MGSKIGVIPGENLILTYVTLGVYDLKRSLEFYRDGLGWQPQSSQGFHYLQMGSVRVALYPMSDLTRDAGMLTEARPAGTNCRGVALAVNVPDQDQVDPLLSKAEKFGGQVMRRGEYKSWGGYVGFFLDPDNNLWEVAWNPTLTFG